MDDKLKRLREDYEAVEIPKELSQIIKNSINGEPRGLQGDKKMNEVKKTSKKLYRGIGSIAAALVILVGGFAVGVNTSEAFASSVQDIPVLSSLAKVFTAQDIHEENDVFVTDMKIPGIEGLKDQELQKEINKLVYDQVTAAVEETKKSVAADKQAWLDTGGKEEDYTPSEISVDYDVKCLTEDVLSFAVYKTETLASAYFDMFYYNYDLKTGEKMTLSGLLGKDYIDIANKQIKDEIAVRSQDENNIYWDGMDEMATEAFSTITPGQQFYVNEKGNPVIIFNKYEIAPGYMGIQEFEIVK